jgi:hypothetical protein
MSFREEDDDRDSTNCESIVAQREPSRRTWYAYYYYFYCYINFQNSNGGFDSTTQNSRTIHRTSLHHHKK